MVLKIIKKAKKWFCDLFFLEKFLIGKGLELMLILFFVP